MEAIVLDGSQREDPPTMICSICSASSILSALFAGLVFLGLDRSSKPAHERHLTASLSQAENCPATTIRCLFIALPYTAWKERLQLGGGTRCQELANIIGHRGARFET